MANEQNLRPGEYKFTKDDSHRGGVASGQAKREKKDLRRCLEILLERDITTKTGEKISGAEAITAKLFEQALKGNVKAFETLRSTVGQDPVQKIMVSEVDQEVIDEVEGMVFGKTKKKEPVDMTGKIMKINVDSGAIVTTYPTATKAARENGLDPSNLAKAIKSGKMLGGFKWQKRE